MRDHLDLDPSSAWQGGHLDRAARREVAIEPPRIHVVHPGEIRQVHEEDRRLDDMAEPELLGFEAGLDVMLHLLGLGPDVARHQVSGGGVERDLA